MALVRPVCFMEHTLSYESVAEGEVLVRCEPCKIRLLVLVLGQAERGNQLLKLGVHQEREVFALELLDSLHKPWDEVMLKDEFTRAVRVLN